MSNGNAPLKIIKTSEERWFAKLVEAYKKKEDVTLIDDANVGIDPAKQNLVQIGLLAKLTPQEWIAVLISLGVGAIGAALVVAAIIDPEPTSKLWLLVGGGITFIGSGGFSAVYILTKIKPPHIKVGPGGFDISWN